MRRKLTNRSNTPRFAFLELDEQGLYMDQGQQVPVAATPHYLERAIAIDKKITDIFVWVHGWRNNRHAAMKTASQLFGGIETVYKKQKARYPNLDIFTPKYVAVHWPSDSTVFGYAKIRDRAHKMTTNGCAEFALASLLGYLEPEKRRGGPPVLQTRGGHYVHCVGHSFGGRFLAEAIAAAAKPSPPTLALLPDNPNFEFTIDTFLVFQMAAPPDLFEGRVQAVFGKAPLQGPVCLTHSSSDTANCSWHARSEGVPAIGCSGATAPASSIGQVQMRSVNEDYTPEELTHHIVNVDASQVFKEKAWFVGSHSDIWYEESIHLLLTLVNHSR